MTTLVNVVGSGGNDARPKLLALLADPSRGLSVVEPKDRLTRFGFRSLDTLLSTQGRAIEVDQQAEHGTADVLADLMAIGSSFCLHTALGAAACQAQDPSEGGP